MFKRLDKKTSCRRMAVAATAMSVAVASMRAFGAVGSLDGTPMYDGAAGFNGTPTDPTPTPGGDATQGSDLEVASSDPSNSATSRGGNGGVGGAADGSSAFAGGHGGAGGEASATASGFTTVGNLTDAATAIGGNGGNGGAGHGGSTGGAGGPGGSSTAVTIGSPQGTGGTATADGGAGGNGGTGGQAGNSITSPGGSGGIGGLGGNASVIAQGPVTDGTTVMETANGTGGAGGTGGTGGAPGTGSRPGHAGGGGAGGSGGSAVLSELLAVGVNLTLHATLTGGNGGTGGLDGNGNLSGAGGTGGSESLITNTAFGSASGSMELDPTLIGGNGGIGNGAGGNGGNAETDIAFAQVGATSLTGNGFNYGGAGGDVTNGNAGGGGDASVTASASANSPVTVMAASNLPTSTYFGAVGQGGDVTGGTGTGGAGGNSLIIATGTGTGTTFASSPVNVTASANPGSGGNVLNGATGNGGAGGNFQVTATGTNQGPGTVNVQATGAGGNGGQGSGAGTSGGVGGYTGFTPSASGTSTGGGTVGVTLQIIGGSGGPGINGATGGRGADVTVNNQVTGSTTGNLNLTQEAIAGNGGSADGGITGTPGDAMSTLNVESAGESYMSISTLAVGGGGGNNVNANGGNSGDATALSIITGSSELLSQAMADGAKSTGGGFSNSSLSEFKGGDGGTYTANASAFGTGITTLDGDIEAYAGATGAPGGKGDSLSSGGNGGLALSSAAATGDSPDSVSAYAQANGGTAGTGATSGINGNAFANATATQNSTGVASASAFASGGIYGTTTATRGIAFPTATAFAPATAQASASGYGASGTITATARVIPAAPGLISFGQSITTLPVDPVAGGIADAQALFDGDQILDSDANGTVFLNVNAGADQITPFWSGFPSVQGVFGNNASNVSTLGLVLLKRATAAGPDTETFSANLEMNLNSAFLTGNDLVVAALSGSDLAGDLQSGDTLRFRIERGGVTLVDQTYGSTAPAGTLNGVVFDLGRGTNSNPAEQDVQVLFDLTSMNPNTSIVSQFIFGNSVATSPNWIGTATGTWTNPSNWLGSIIPAGPGSSASFNDNSAQVITLDESTTLGSITFGNSLGDAISPAAPNFSLTLDNAGSPAAITITAGNHTISAPLLFSVAGLATSVPGGSSLFLGAGLSGPGALTLNGPGTIQLLPSSGTAVIGNLIFGSPIIPGIAGGGAVPDELVSSPGTLDITNNALIVEATNAADKAAKIAALQAAAQSGYSTGTSGPWTGVGLTSSTVAADAAAGTNHTFHTVVAIVDNGAYPAGTSFTSFGGQLVDANSIIVTRALAGDANLDGTVNNTDLVALLTHFTLSGQTQATGDYNGDGTVNNTDLVALLTDYEQTLPGGFSVVAAGASSAGGTLGGPTPVPEPASLVVLLVAGPCLVRRRRHGR